MLFLSVLLACSSEVDNQPAAEVTTPVAAPAPAPAPAPEAAAPAGDGLAVKVDASSIGFVGAKVTGDHEGGFKGFEGSLSVADGKPTATSFTIDMNTTWADAGKLEGHLKSGDFFDVENHPQASFTSSSITAGEGGYTVVGTLNFVGKEAEITFPAAIEVGEGSAKATAEFTIDRTLWGVTYPGKPDNLIKDEVLIKLDLSFGA